MNIINRNLMRLLRAGMYHDFDDIEPMSTFKWHRLMQYASVMGVSDVTARGARNFQFSKNPLPDMSLFNIADNANLYEQLSDEAMRDKELSNALLNHRLQNIYKKELKADDPSPETVKMLNLLIFNTTSLLQSDVTLPPLMIAGLFLRRNGDMVDFIKLQQWIELLGMQHFASFIGSLLIDALGFSAEEVQFVSQHRPEAILMLERNILRMAANPNTQVSSDDKYFTLNSAGFVTASGQMFRRSIRTTMRFFTYSPIMATGAFLHQLSRNLKDLEE